MSAKIAEDAAPRCDETRKEEFAQTALSFLLFTSFGLEKQARSHRYRVLLKVAFTEW